MLREMSLTTRWPGVGGLPYVYLVFLVYLFIAPFRSDAAALVWILTIGSIFVFLPLYFAQFGLTAQPSRRTFLLNLAIACLGFALLPINSGATTYVIYSAAGAGFVLRPRAALQYLVALAVAVGVEVFFLPVEYGYWMALPTIALIGTVGGSNVYQAEQIRHQATLRRAQEDVEEMAKVAERERIARDLHDLLGHTLSVIALKSELASKLADRDPVGAIREIRDVEQVSRQALTEVRRAVEGYHQQGFTGELLSARRALDAAGVQFDAQIAPLDLPPRSETALALAVREAVTNVIRHAGATRCMVRLQADGREVTLSVEDNGRGGAVAEGSGLTGMRSRLAALGGTVHVDGERGLRLLVTLPAAPAGAAT